jgi:predicted nuclease with TOPRIM domain
MTLAMIIMIAVGCALVLAGLGLVLFRLVRLARQARQIGITSLNDVQEIARRVEALGPRLAELEAKQRRVAERLDSLSATLSKLTYLWGEVDRVLGPLTKLKS